jgi:hypothetical protein
MKVNSSIYKGIQYVQINALPPDQKEKILSTLNRELFIKILVDGKMIGNCLQFKDYEVWFDNVYSSESQIGKAPRNLVGHPDVKLIEVALKDHGS